jgi:alkanesulfonate monooxygenase SsuD/methylene tetrahydromethanopterin reductase-like flavin-dependent oxidoreductase (luciferase family)
MTWDNRLGAVGVWRGLNDIDPAMAKTIEELGFGTIWQGGSSGSDLRAAEELLDATESLHLATAIVNIWRSDPSELADSYHRIEARYPGRSLLGIGSGHREATPERVGPLDAMAKYLDVLDERRAAAGSGAFGVGSADVGVGGRAEHWHASVCDRSVAVWGRSDDSGAGRIGCARADGRVRYRPGFCSAYRPQLSAPVPEVGELPDHDAAGRVQRS